MIVERLVFRTKFGQGDTVAEAFKKAREQFARRFDLPSQRILVDATGPMFTVVVESEYRDLAHVAQAAEQEQQYYADPEFADWFGTWMAAVESGHRELLRVVD